MITNLPTSEDFEVQCAQYLFQAIDLMYKHEHKYVDGLYIDQEVEESFWGYHQGLLNSSLVLVFLSLENYLKSNIVRTSPLLLIDGEPKKWGTSGQDKKFEDLFIHQFEDLIVIYNEINTNKIDDKTKGSLDELRIKRNRITHGIPSEKIGPSYVAEVIYVFLNNVWGGEWWRRVKEHVESGPLFGAHNEGIEEAEHNLYIKFLEKHLSKKKVGDLLGIDLMQRRYHCPRCSHWAQDGGFVEDFKYAVLTPNTPESTQVYCGVCQSNYTVRRDKCLYEECLGNVVNDNWGYCLTCFNGTEE